MSSSGVEFVAVAEPSKKLLAMVQLPKPWSQMTEAEKQAFVKETAQLAQSRMQPEPPQAA
jgi:hypothetical protein